jgi:formate/nitrite transporter FocA (FNT family)
MANPPTISPEERAQADDLKALSVHVVHEAVRKNGEEELERPAAALAWSGVAAGLSMGFSFMAEGLLRAHLPDTPWRPLVTKLGYSTGFLIVIIARQQLFTENTLTAVIPFLANRTFAKLWGLVKLWAVVLIANLAGAHLFAWALGNTPVVASYVQTALRDIATEAGNITFGSAVLRGIFAGWLIALIVWMLAAIEHSHVAIIAVLTYLVGLASLTHIIAGSVEILFLVMTGVRSWWTYAAGYMIPTLVGNIIGGVAFVSLLNHAQVVAGHSGDTNS